MNILNKDLLSEQNHKKKTDNSLTFFPYSKNVAPELINSSSTPKNSFLYVYYEIYLHNCTETQVDNLFQIKNCRQQAHNWNETQKIDYVLFQLPA